MKVYDFDGTIYDGDSTADFILFCLRRRPALLRFLPKQVWGLLLYAAGIYKKERMKEHLYTFFQGIEDIDGEVEAFWNVHLEKVKPWYLEQKQESDCIISASPEFLLEPVAQRLGFKLIASRVSSKTGLYEGLNCHGSEKVVRFEAVHGAAAVDAFYSDTASDTPMALRAAEAFRVRRHEVMPWNDYRPTAVERIKKMFLSRTFFMFVLIGGINTLNGIAFAYLFSSLLQENLAFMAGYLTSLVISYLLNSFFTFHEALGFGKFIRFAISYVPNFFIQNLVVLLLFNVLGWPKLVAYVLAALIGVPVTFVLMKVFAFAKKRSAGGRKG